MRNVFINIYICRACFLFLNLSRINSDISESIMSTRIVTRGSTMLRNVMFYKKSPRLVSSELRSFSSETENEPDEYKFETLSGDFEGE